MLIKAEALAEFLQHQLEYKINLPKENWASIAALVVELNEAKTVYTVPLHVGQNIEVPKGSIVTFYDPVDYDKEVKVEYRCMACLKQFLYATDQRRIARNDHAHYCPTCGSGKIWCTQKRLV